MDLTILEVAYPLLNLAILYYEQGKYAEAEPLYQRSLRIREQTLGPEPSPHTKSRAELCRPVAQDGARI